MYDVGAGQGHGVTRHEVTACTSIVVHIALHAFLSVSLGPRCIAPLFKSHSMLPVYLSCSLLSSLQGWQYGTVFKHLQYKREGGRASQRFGDVVRRRQWRQVSCRGAAGEALPG
jgi:hypothetical protein